MAIAPFVARHRRINRDQDASYIVGHFCLAAFVDIAHVPNSADCLRFIVALPDMTVSVWPHSLIQQTLGLKLLREPRIAIVIDLHNRSVIWHIIATQKAIHRVHAVAGVPTEIHL